jgi:hypothetical protein
MEEIRAWIAEILQKCKNIIKYGGKPLKSELW